MDGMSQPEEATMPSAAESLVKKLVVLATVAGLGSALAFLLVACGGTKAAQPPRTDRRGLARLDEQGADRLGRRLLWRRVGRRLCLRLRREQLADALALTPRSLARPARRLDGPPVARRRQRLQP